VSPLKTFELLEFYICICCLIRIFDNINFESACLIAKTSPLLFAIAIDWVMRRVMESSDAGISWVEDAKLIWILPMRLHSPESLLTACNIPGQYWKRKLVKVGLCINPVKCKVMVSGTLSETAEIQVQGSTVEVVDEFCYLVCALRS